MEILLKTVEAFFGAMAVAFGLMLAIWIFITVANRLERAMLSQDCDRYFETLYEENLVPHRCYDQSTKEILNAKN